MKVKKLLHRIEKRKAEIKAEIARITANPEGWCLEQLLPLQKELSALDHVPILFSTGIDYKTLLSSSKKLQEYDIKPEQPQQSITINGETYKVGDKFRWIGCDLHFRKGEIVTISEIKYHYKYHYVTMDEHIGEWHPWDKQFWQRVEEKSEWDEKFVPGEYYQSTDGMYIVLCQDGEPIREDFFYGVAVKGTHVGETTLNGGWVKKSFRPVKVKITVEE